MTAVVGREVTRAVRVVIGVDTHQDEHVAVAIDQQGVRLAECYAPATSYGYSQLERWSRKLGEVHAFGVEGTGSYGAGLARFLTLRGHKVVEVNRPDRSTRYRKGKSDPTDAEMAARAVLAGVALATPKSGKGETEMIRMLKSAKDSAVQGTHPGRQPDEGPGRHGPGRTSRNTGRSDGYCLGGPVQELPPGSSRGPHGSSQVHPPVSCLPLPSTQQGDPRPAGRDGTADPDGSPVPGQRLRGRTRHGDCSVDHCRQQPSTHSLRGCLRLV